MEREGEIESMRILFYTQFYNEPKTTLKIKSIKKCSKIFILISILHPVPFTHSGPLDLPLLGLSQSHVLSYINLSLLSERILNLTSSHHFPYHHPRLPITTSPLDFCMSPQSGPLASALPLHSVRVDLIRTRIRSYSSP